MGSGHRHRLRIGPRRRICSPRTASERASGFLKGGGGRRRVRLPCNNRWIGRRFYRPMRRRIFPPGGLAVTGEQDKARTKGAHRPGRCRLSGSAPPKVAAGPTPSSPACLGHVPSPSTDATERVPLGRTPVDRPRSSRRPPTCARFAGRGPAIVGPAFLPRRGHERTHRSASQPRGPLKGTVDPITMLAWLFLGYTVESAPVVEVPVEAPATPAEAEDAAPPAVEEVVEIEAAAPPAEEPKEEAPAATEAPAAEPTAEVAPEPEEKPVEEPAAVEVVGAEPAVAEPTEEAKPEAEPEVAAPAAEESSEPAVKEPEAVDEPPAAVEEVKAEEAAEEKAE
ncbi:hypothetical protein MUK42_15411 [Musa troglodytarum]|uniref:Uncharacterized protein n=1 Tax=Musa troglodytarum TaxID=320322 RepID=A0A9E7L6Z7_9LILI|nr:hypothetical protein MUK42_15411 [Musa troglodytarum]